MRIRTDDASTLAFAANAYARAVRDMRRAANDRPRAGTQSEQRTCTGCRLGGQRLGRTMGTLSTWPSAPCGAVLLMPPATSLWRRPPGRAVPRERRGGPRGGATRCMRVLDIFLRTVCPHLPSQARAHGGACCGRGANAVELSRCSHRAFLVSARHLRAIQRRAAGRSGYPTDARTRSPFGRFLLMAAPCRN